MNGRCETDPLDPAVDVCDRCYGEFCARHLVRPRGRRHPFCSGCALDASGVRGTTKLEPRGSRRTVKQRRTELNAAIGEAEEVFRFFDIDQELEVSEPEAETTDANGNWIPPILRGN